MSGLDPFGAAFLEFVSTMTGVIAIGAGEGEVLDVGSVALGALLAEEGWLPESHARPLEGTYAQYLLHRNDETGLTIVSFVWGPGQSTPIHDHGTWGLIGVLRGVECSQAYDRGPGGTLLRSGEVVEARRGDIDRIVPGSREIHKVWNPSADEVAISIHVYGRDVSTVERHAFDEDGNARPFGSSFTTPWAGGAGE